MEKKGSLRRPTAPRPVRRSVQRYWMSRLREPSTWLGLLAIGAIVATGDTAEWLNPENVSLIAAGLGLITTEDGGQRSEEEEK